MKQHALFWFVFRNNHDPNVGGKISCSQGIVSFKNIFSKNVVSLAGGLNWKLKSNKSVIFGRQPNS